ncbi:hypothetical protein [Symmachiella dynata]|nr:hypothetical protein [Symmachiella dynata]
MLKLTPIRILPWVICCVLWAGPGSSILVAQEFQKGDPVTVTAESAELKAGKTVVAVIRRGEKQTVEQVNGKWLLITVTIDGKAQQGWINAKDVAPFKPTPTQPTTTKPPAKQPSTMRARTPQPKKNVRPRSSTTPLFNQVGTLRGHTEDVNCLTFSADGQTIVTGGRDRNIIVWDVGDHKPLSILTGHKRRIRCLQFSPVMDVILASGGGEISHGELKLWNLKEQKLVADLPVGDTEVTSLGFSPDGTRLFTAGWSQSVSVWDVITTRRRGAARTSFGEIVTYLAVSPLEEMIAVDGKQGLVYLQNSENLLETEGPSTATQHILSDHKKDITALCFSGDGRLLATGSEGPFAIVWDPKTGEPVRNFDTQNGPITAVGLSYDGKWLATANRPTDAPLKIWDVATGRLVGELDAGSVRAVAFSPTDPLLATSDGAEVRLWSLRPPRVLKSR